MSASLKAVPSDFVPLNKSQQTSKGFDCGKEAINKFLSFAAARNMAANISTTFVVPYKLPGEKGKGRIAAFYTLVHNSIERETLPEDKNLPHYPVPVILIAQLGVDKNFKGQGLGKKTLITALRHAHSTTTSKDSIPSYGIILDILDADARAFYESFDFFTELTPDRLFVPIKSIGEILKSSDLC